MHLHIKSPLRWYPAPPTGGCGVRARKHAKSFTGPDIRPEGPASSSLRVNERSICDHLDLVRSPHHPYIRDSMPRRSILIDCQTGYMVLKQGSGLEWSTFFHLSKDAICKVRVCLVGYDISYTTYISIGYRYGSLAKLTEPVGNSMEAV